jgi:amylosucrase
MTKQEWTEQQARITLARLIPRIETRFASFVKSNPNEWLPFSKRLDENFERLFAILLHLYQDRYDFFYYLEELLAAMVQSWIDRPTELKTLDLEREAIPDWFQSNQMVGGVCYVDLFAEDLEGIRTKIPYFKELGLTYLHLMPLFKVPTGENDGGYAISSYREVNPALGTMDILKSLATDLRSEGISLVLDFVFNHTSNEHEWAQRAIKGNPEYLEYYRIFPDRQMPDAYERHLREIFPEEHPGAFTFNEEINQWVWTTFHSYQWDLNYANPAVFISMAEEMLFLANAGVEVLRLDAVAFTWKQIGTNCENLPEAHLLIQAYNAIARIVAPAMLFKSEAIVHPDEVAKYIDPTECQISYNPLLMALLWESLATRKVSLLSTSLAERFEIDPQCAWVNYVRCHDDIGWTFSDEDAARIWINGYDHRRFLNAFYTGRFEGSFARGLPFQENPKTGDARISGTCASLAGLEKAIKDEASLDENTSSEDAAEVELAIRRILLIHSVILTIGGIPLIYLNDEVGTLNDYGFRDDLSKANDSRWVHRPTTNWEKVARREDAETIEGLIFQNLTRLIDLRKSHPVFSGGEMQIIDAGDESVFGYLRTHGNERALVFANFSEREHTIPANLLRLYGLSYSFEDLLKGDSLPFKDLTLAPYQFVCLAG